MKKRYILFLMFFPVLMLCITDLRLFAQQSDYEIFLEFKKELKSVKEAYRNFYLPQKAGEEKNLSNTFNGFTQQIYTDYANKSTAGLKDLLPSIEEKFKNFMDRREALKKEYLDKVNSFITKWENPGKKSVVEKAGKDYELNFSDEIGTVKDVQSDLQLENVENLDRIKQFLTVIINDKVELISLRDSIDVISMRVNQLISEQANDQAKAKQNFGNLMTENNRRKELILKLVGTIVSEHKLLPSKDLAEVKPSPFASEMFNMMNSFMTDYINLTANLKGDPDPANMKNAISAQKDVATKFDSLYESCEKAKILKKGEKEELIQKSRQWRTDLYFSLENAIMKEFTNNNLPVIFNKDNTTSWFTKSLADYLTPYTERKNPLNSDLVKSQNTLKSFTQSWDNIKTKWSPALIEAGYLNDKTQADIDSKLNLWKDIAGEKGFTKSWGLFALIGGAVILIGIILILVLRKKKSTPSAT